MTADLVDILRRLLNDVGWSQAVQRSTTPDERNRLRDMVRDWKPPAEPPKEETCT